MSNRDQKRIVTLRSALKIARDALVKIQHNPERAWAIAEEARENVDRLIWQDSPSPAHEPTRARS